MIAIYEAYRKGLLGFRNWLPNVVAGLIVGVVALPLAMAFVMSQFAPLGKVSVFFSLWHNNPDFQLPL
jgi:MFS superfamily sulfate permease-like transporter